MLKSVNTTESKICGIPKTQPSNVITALENYNVRRNSPWFELCITLFVIHYLMHAAVAYDSE